MINDLKRFFIYIHFRDSSKDRLSQSAKTLLELMKSYFDNDFKLIFASQDSIGFFVTTTKHPNAIKTALVSPETNRVRPFGDPIVHGDEVLILEIGEDFATYNLGVAENWLSSN